MTQHVTKMWEIALDETAGMRYSVYVSGRMPLAYYSPEMTGFYNCNSHSQLWADNYSPARNDRVL